MKGGLRQAGALQVGVNYKGQEPGVLKHRAPAIASRYLLHQLRIARSKMIKAARPLRSSLSSVTGRLDSFRPERRGLAHAGG